MNDKIIQCRDWQLDDPKKCKNPNNLLPLAMPIPNCSRIMIVSQAPSNPASKKQILANRENRTYNQFLEILNITEDQFNTYVYWTHYAKCYPGKKQGGDQWPTVHCANKYIDDEIQLCNKRQLSLVVGIAEPASKYLYKKYVMPEIKRNEIVYRNILNNIYTGQDETLIFCFLQHTASTAAWSRDERDKKFIQETLQPLVRELLRSSSCTNK